MGARGRFYQTSQEKGCVLQQGCSDVDDFPHRDSKVYLRAKFNYRLLT